MFDIIHKLPDNENNNDNQQVEISFKKNKVKIKVDWQIVFLKAWLTIEERNKFYLAKYQDSFIELILEYKKSDEIRNKINEYLKNLDINTHIIKSIMDKLYLTKELFNNREKNIEIKLTNFIKEVKQTVSSNNNNTNFHLDAFISDNILSDVYWTTTMEGWKINVREIKENTSNDKLIATEADNIYKSFIEITNILKENQFNWFLDIDLIKYFHSLNTNWLDKILKDWLSYKPWEFRKWNISMWIFQTLEWKQEIYYPPENWKLYLKMLVDEFNKQIEKQNWKINLTDMAIFHLVFYAIHPFWNWNKRTTRVIESLLIQYQFDKFHFLKWMWYWFRQNIDAYFNIMKKVLSWQAEAREWLKFYLNYFEDMIEYSKISFEVNQNFNISKYINKSRLYLYSEKDKKLIEYMLVLKRNWENN